jgi:hypothetical protein
MEMSSYLKAKREFMDRVNKTVGDGAYGQPTDDLFLQGVVGLGYEIGEIQIRMHELIQRENIIFDGESQTLLYMSALLRSAAGARAQNSPNMCPPEASTKNRKAHEAAFVWPVIDMAEYEYGGHAALVDIRFAKPMTCLSSSKLSVGNQECCYPHGFAISSAAKVSRVCGLHSANLTVVSSGRLFQLDNFLTDCLFTRIAKVRTGFAVCHNLIDTMHRLNTSTCQLTPTAKAYEESPSSHLIRWQMRKLQ